MTRIHIFNPDLPVFNESVSRSRSNDDQIEVYVIDQKLKSFKGLSYEIDLENVDENWQILA